MRGDSLRDLYAKTLAVLGLGLLAAAGAVVDYWPVNGAWPAVPVATGLRTEAPALVADPHVNIPAPRSMHAALPTTPRDTSRSFSKAFRSVRFVEPVAEVAPASPVPELDLTSAEYELSPLLIAMSSVEIDLDPPAAVLASGAPQTSRPILTGAVSALKKTRASLREAFRGVVGTFRKVSPFWETTGTPSFR